MGRGHQGRSLRPFHVSQHHPSPPRLLLARILNKPAGEGPRGQAGPGRLGLCGSVLDGGGEAEGAGTRARDPQPGLDPQVHCPAGARPPPPRGPRPDRHPAPSQRLPPPAAPTSRSPDQGPDVESSPQAGSSGAVHSAAPASSSHRLTPPPGRTLGAPRLLGAGARAPASPQPQSPGPAAPRHATPRHAGARAGSAGGACPAAALGAAEAGDGRRTVAGRPESMPAQPR